MNALRHSCAGFIALAIAASLFACTSSPTTPASPSGPAQARTADDAARAFLSNYVVDGRVVRKDQGSDTVSEGQAYGMLIAVSIGDENAFDSIYAWTTANLVQTDGLMAWDWKDGKIIDNEPASDADLDAARALVEAGKTFNEPDLIAKGNALGEVILDKLTVTTAAGRILLPGLWAATSEPYAYNPSYASPAAFSVLSESSGDARWQELASGSRAVTSALLTKSGLPPDWAQVHADGTVDSMPGARGTGTTVQYSYDAARLPLRYAESCDPADTALAAKLISALQRQSDVFAQLDLGGGALTTDQSSVGYDARAAALAAAGQANLAEQDLSRADQLEQSNSTYYGAAWSALAQQELQAGTLGSCAPLHQASGAANAMQDPAAQQTSTSEQLAGVVPTHLQIAQIGVDTSLEALTKDASGEIVPPQSFSDAGWYKDGVVPGDLGPAVIAGHIDSATGPAIFDQLATLKPGAVIDVTLSDNSTVSFVVDSTITVPKQQFPTTQVYGPTPTAQLRVITCGGAFDDSYGHYLDNVVVFAHKSA
ncbi:class F sortase [Subtercola lobariae]|uniref:Class F sortase n=1 Tax=Subtercola lobariae TaxID=1588641 RepID=A0A917BJ04_9MICO|nr:class F sortase [Subtercola lobariae]GGF41493.1 hypothetical protein GCM10011399_37710 [Subtercola lobariae]